MTTTTEKTMKVTNDIPEELKHLLTEDAQAVLDKYDMAIKVKVLDSFMRLYGSSFAANHDQIPFVAENTETRYGFGRYTCIKDDEFGDTTDKTAKNVLTRLGFDPKEMHYWAVYVHELDAPNHEGLTKVFTDNPEDFANGKGHFAGIGYCEAKEVIEAGSSSTLDDFKARLLKDLGGIEKFINDMILLVTVLDAESGLLMGHFEVLNKPEHFNKKLMKRSEGLALACYSSKEFIKSKAEYLLGGHIIPEQYQHLLSEHNKARLEKLGVLIKVFELPNGCMPHQYCNKFFGVDGRYPDNQFSWAGQPSDQYAVIAEHELGDTVEATALNVMAGMEGDVSDMSYFAVYSYELETPDELGRTKIFTTEARENTDEKSALVGIAVSYNYGIPPNVDVNELGAKHHINSVIARVAKMTDDEKLIALEQWKQRELTMLSAAIEYLELFENKNIVGVSYHNAKDGSTICRGGYPYKKVVAGFNEKMKAKLDIIEHNHNNPKVDVRGFLRTANLIIPAA